MYNIFNGTKFADSIFILITTFLKRNLWLKSIWSLLNIMFTFNFGSWSVGNSSEVLFLELIPAVSSPFRYPQRQVQGCTISHSKWNWNNSPFLLSLLSLLSINDNCPSDFITATNTFKTQSYTSLSIPIFLITSNVSTWNNALHCFL